MPRSISSSYSKYAAVIGRLSKVSSATQSFSLQAPDFSTVGLADRISGEPFLAVTDPFFRVIHQGCDVMTMVMGKLGESGARAAMMSVATED